MNGISYQSVAVVCGYLCSIYQVAGERSCKGEGRRRAKNFLVIGERVYFKMYVFLLIQISTVHTLLILTSEQLYFLLLLHATQRHHRVH